jgi:hypothetical protein
VTGEEVIEFIHQVKPVLTVGIKKKIFLYPKEFIAVRTAVLR